MRSRQNDFSRMDDTVNSYNVMNSKKALIFSSAIVFLSQFGIRTNSTIILLVSYILALMLGFFSNKTLLFGIILFLLPDNRILDFGGISIQLLLMIVFIIKNIFGRNVILNKKTTIFGFIISVYSIIYFDLGLGYILQGAKLAIMIFFYTSYLVSCKPDLNIYTMYLRYGVIGILVSIFAAMLFNPSFLNASRFALSQDSNWNMLGIWAAVLFSHSFLCCFLLRRNIIRYVVYSIAMIACALITTSRTALLVIGFSSIWIVIFVNKSYSSFRKFVFSVTIAVVIALIIGGVITIPYLDRVVNRIVDPRRGDISNGRFTLWARYIDYLSKDSKVLWFGHGSATIEGITTLTSSISTMAHNMFIEQITYYGLIGTIIVFGLYKSSFLRIVHEYDHFSTSKRKLSYLVNVIIIFVAGFFSHIITSVLVTTELYFGLLCYLVMNIKVGDCND